MNTHKVPINIGLAALVLGVASINVAHSEDSCRDVLLKNLSETQISKGGQSSSLAAAHARCATNKQNTGTKVNHGGNLDVPGYFKLGYSDGSDGNSASDSSDCGSDSSEQHFQSARYYAYQSNAVVVRAWETCMSRKEKSDLICSAKSEGDPRHLTVNINWTRASANPQVRLSQVRIGDSYKSIPFPVGAKLQLGDNLILIDRAPQQSVTVDMSAGDGTYATSCNVFIPAIEKLTVTMAAAASSNALWTNTPFNSIPPSAPGRCTCVDPQRVPLIFGGPFHPAPAPGTIVVFTNSCKVNLKILGVEETAPSFKSNLHPLPLTSSSAGRRYFQAQLPEGGKLAIDMTGALSGAIFVGNCPPERFEPQ